MGLPISPILSTSWTCNEIQCARVYSVGGLTEESVSNDTSEQRVLAIQFVRTVCGANADVQGAAESVDAQNNPPSVMKN